MFVQSEAKQAFWRLHPSQAEGRIEDTQRWVGNGTVIPRGGAGAAQTRPGHGLHPPVLIFPLSDQVTNVGSVWLVVDGITAVAFHPGR